MRIYQASLNLRTLLHFYKLFPEIKLNILRSFGQLSNQEYSFHNKHGDKINSMILDSGCFTLNYAKEDVSAKINLPNYGDYALTTINSFDWQFNFDSDFSNNGFPTNLRNLKWLETMGLKPVPVVHDIYGNEISYYISHGYKRVALGSKQIKSNKTLGLVMNKFRRTKTKIHLFGNTKFELLANYPIHSCDTAMWARTGGYGFINYWNPKRKGVNKTDRIYMQEYLNPDKSKRTTYSKYRYKSDLDEFLWNTFKITYQDIMGSEGAYLKMLVNTFYYVQLERTITKIHELKGFDTSDV